MAFTYKNNWKDVEVRLERNLRDSVRSATVGVQTQIVANITTEKLVDTGNYRRSWTFELDGDGNGATVGSPVEYGPYLEYGTRRMPARAHVVPAATTISRRINDYFRGLDR